ncbi:MAG: aldose 1-epimerase [bacterium]
MYVIDHIKDKNILKSQVVLKNSNNTTHAKIFLNLGGSLQNLILNNKVIIKDLYPLKYDASYASAILFPFVNRVKDGTYKFMQKEYKLAINLKEENNAIHGLVYNKEFNIVHQEVTEELATISIEYVQNERSIGFPFYYTLLLTYTLTNNTLTLKVKVKNTDTHPFPFNIGWHPYFMSSNLYESFLSFKSEQKLTFNEDMIPRKIKDINIDEQIQIKDKKLDDCYILKTNTVGFKTPDYSIKIHSSSEKNYIQLYTPKLKNTIAIEPTTGVSNSFNNKIGLQILEKEETYNVQWTINLQEND